MWNTFRSTSLESEWDMGVWNKLWVILSCGLANFEVGQISNFYSPPPHFFLTAQLTAPASLLTTEKQKPSNMKLNLSVLWHQYAHGEC